MTPIGNPQNVLVAVESGVPALFIAFVKILALSTIVNLVATAWILIKVFMVEKRRIEVGLIPHEAIRSKRDAILAGIGIVLTVALLVANDVFSF